MISVDSKCLNLCQVCVKLAPANLQKGTTSVEVKKQPESPEELQALAKAAQVCPVEAIHSTEPFPTS